MRATPGSEDAVIRSVRSPTRSPSTAGNLSTVPTTLSAGLPRRFDLQLDDLLAAEPKNATSLYAFGNGYSFAQAQKDYAALYPLIQEQAKRIGDFSYKQTGTALLAVARLPDGRVGGAKKRRSMRRRRTASIPVSCPAGRRRRGELNRDSQMIEATYDRVILALPPWRNQDRPRRAASDVDDLERDGDGGAGGSSGRGGGGSRLKSEVVDPLIVMRKPERA